MLLISSFHCILIFWPMSQNCSFISNFLLCLIWYTVLFSLAWSKCKYRQCLGRILLRNLSSFTEIASCSKFYEICCLLAPCQEGFSPKGFLTFAEHHLTVLHWTQWCFPIPISPKSTYRDIHLNCNSNNKMPSISFQCQELWRQKS